MDVPHEHEAIKYNVSLNQEVTMFKLDMRSVQVPGSQNKNKQLSHAQKKRPYFPLYWLFRDPCFMVYYNPHITG